MGRGCSVLDTGLCGGSTVGPGLCGGHVLDTGLCGGSVLDTGLCGGSTVGPGLCGGSVLDTGLCGESKLGTGLCGGHVLDTELGGGSDDWGSPVDCGRNINDFIITELLQAKHYEQQYSGIFRRGNFEALTSVLTGVEFLLTGEPESTVTSSCSVVGAPWLIKASQLSSSSDL